MSTTTHVPAETEAADAARWERDAELHLRVVQDMITRPDAYDAMPNRCLLVLVPDDDPTQADWAIRRGSDAAQRGRNVYLRHVTVAELPPAPTVQAERPGTRRIEYDPPGTVARVTVLDEDGVWHEVEPTPEDAAGLPPATNARW